MNQGDRIFGWARRHPQQFILCWMAVTLCLVLGVGSYNLWQERQRIHSKAAGMAQVHADAVASRVEASIAKADVLLSALVRDLRRLRGRKDASDLEQALLAVQRQHPEIMAIMLVREDGSLSFSSRPMAGSRLNFSDRAYFRYHQLQTDTALRIGDPVISRMTGEPVIPVTLRINGAGGEFAGIAFVGITVHHFLNEFRRMSGADSTMVVIERSDGTLLMQVPPAPTILRIPPGMPSARAGAEDARTDAGSRVFKPKDGIERVLATRHLHHYPLVAYAGIAIRDLDAEWLDTLRLKVPLLAAVLLLLLASGLVIYHQLQREAKSRIRLKVLLQRSDRSAQQALTLNGALQKATDFQQAVLNSTSCGIIVTNVFGEIVFLNRATTKILGFSAEEVVGKMSPLVFHRTEDIRMALQRIRPGDLPYQLMVTYLNANPGREWEFVRRDGSKVMVSIAITALANRQGQPDGFVTIFHDLTEIRRLEGMKSDFVSVVSHELRTPVTAIRGALSLHQAAIGESLSLSQKKLLAISIDNCDKLVRIVSDILDIDKLSRHQMVLNRSAERVDHLVDWAISQTQPFADQYGVSYRLSTPPSELAIHVDADRFNQIMVNLLSNAAKFSSPNTEVVVSIRDEAQGVVIRVVDYGAGIPAAFQPHVFERFSQSASALTRRAGGTGLGLAITKMLVDAHEGEISFSSEEGMGTTFTLRFPPCPVALQRTA